MGVVGVAVAAGVGLGVGVAVDEGKGEMIEPEEESGSQPDEPVENLETEE